jgi:hypothetical protein
MVPPSVQEALSKKVAGWSWMQLRN